NSPTDSSSTGGSTTVGTCSGGGTKPFQAVSSSFRYRSERRQAALEFLGRAPRGAGRLSVGRVGFSWRLNCFASTGKKLLTAETRQVSQRSRRKRLLMSLRVANVCGT